MNTQINKNRNGTFRDFTWIYEVVLFLTVTPALVHVVASLDNPVLAPLSKVALFV